MHIDALVQSRCSLIWVNQIHRTHMDPLSDLCFILPVPSSSKRLDWLLSAWLQVLGRNERWELWADAGQAFSPWSAVRRSPGRASGGAEVRTSRDIPTKQEPASFPMSGLMRVESWKLRFVLEPFKRRGVASKKGRCLPFRCARFRTSCGDVGHWGRQGFLGNVVLPDMMPLNNNEKPENCSEKEKQRGHVVMQDGESSRKKREDHGCIMMYIMCIYIYICLDRRGQTRYCSGWRSKVWQFSFPGRLRVACWYLKVARPCPISWTSQAYFWPRLEALPVLHEPPGTSNFSIGSQLT